MKKIYILLLVSVLGTSTMFAQGFGASLDYAMWNGAMIENSETTGSTIISVNYTQNLSKKMDLVGSVGYGIGFGVSSDQNRFELWLLQINCLLI